MVKIIFIAVLCGIILLMLKNINQEYFTVGLVCSGLILSLTCLQYVTTHVELINKLVNMSGVSNSVYKIILKIVGVGYLTEFSSTTIEDFGLNSLSKKVTLAGKLIILVLSTPIIYSLLDVITSIAQQ